MKMKKKKVKAYDGSYEYLLGKGKDGELYWLEESEWKENWYWAGDTIVAFRDKKNPAQVQTKYTSHLINRCGIYGSYLQRTDERLFTDFFEETPFTEEEIKLIMELFQSFYTASEYACMLYKGGYHIADNPVKGVRNYTEYKRITDEVIPEIFDELYKVLYEEPRYSVVETTDAFGPEDAFAIWDSKKDKYYVADKTIVTFESKSEAKKYLKKMEKEGEIHA